MKLAVIGDPLRQSVSDFMHDWIYEALGLEAEYKKIKVAAEGLERWVGLPSAKKLAGFNVTIPHKSSIIPYLDEVNDRSAAIGAINCVRRDKDGKLTGYNTDWYGFVKSLETAMVDLSGKKVVVLGSGGAARAITFGLARMGAGKMTVVARNPDHAKSLISDLTPAAEGMQLEACDWDGSAVEPIEEAYCLVNCTPIGMKPNKETPIDGDLLASLEVIVDTVFNPLNTRLLSEAVFSDVQTVSGLDMYLYQAMASVDIWFGPQDWDKINMNAMREAVHNKITGFKRKFE